jgi:pimeloyl-ACP methyl ester carboxylesterase
MISCKNRYIEIDGGDPPVVFLHGLYGSPENWRAVMRSLKGQFRLLALQFPIDHQSCGPRVPSIAQLTDYVKKFLDQLRLKSAVVCGNSLGGLVAIDFCLRHSHRAQRLVLTGSAGLYEHNLHGGRIPRPTPEFIRDQASRLFYDKSHVTDRLVDEVQQDLSDRQYARFIIGVAKSCRDRSARIREELGQLRQPTLLVWGRDDQITPPSLAEEFRSGIQDAELVLIDRCGHVPPMEHPAEFSQCLSQFLESKVHACPTNN